MCLHTAPHTLTTCTLPSVCYECSASRLQAGQETAEERCAGKIGFLETPSEHHHGETTEDARRDSKGTEKPLSPLSHVQEYHVLGRSPHKNCKNDLGDQT